MDEFLWFACLHSGPDEVTVHIMTRAIQQYQFGQNRGLIVGHIS